MFLLEFPNCQLQPTLGADSYICSLLPDAYSYIFYLAWFCLLATLGANSYVNFIVLYFNFRPASSFSFNLRQ